MTDDESHQEFERDDISLMCDKCGKSGKKISRHALTSEDFLVEYDARNDKSCVASEHQSCDSWSAGISSMIDSSKERDSQYSSDRLFLEIGANAVSSFVAVTIETSNASTDDNDTNGEGNICYYWFVD